MKRFVIEYTDYGFLNMDGEGVNNTEIIEARNILEASKKFFQHHDDDCYIESVFEDETDRVDAIGVIDESYSQADIDSAVQVIIGSNGNLSPGEYRQSLLDNGYDEKTAEEMYQKVRKAVDEYNGCHTDYYEAGEHQEECESIEHDETPETKLCWRCRRAIDDHNGPQEYNQLFADENLICDWCEDEIPEGEDYYTFK